MTTRRYPAVTVWFVFWFFGPSLTRLSPGFLATTTSADFSKVLTSEISPSKVLNLSGRAAELYLLDFR